VKRQPHSTDFQPAATAAHVVSSHPGFVGALFTLLSANFLIRVAGLGLQVVITYRYGINTATDTYNALYLFIVTMARLIVVGLEAALVPTYVRVRPRGAEATSIFVSSLFNALLIILLIGTGLLYLLRRQLLIVSAPGLVYVTEASAIASGIAPYLIPMLALVTLIGFIESLLNAEGHFGWPAYAGILAPLITAAIVIGGTDLPLASYHGGMVLLGIGHLVGLLANLGAVMFRAHQAGLRYHLRLRLRDPDVRAVAALSKAPMMGALLGNLGPLVDQVCASTLGQGTITALAYAQKITGAFVVIVLGSASTVILPQLARYAAANDMTAFKRALRLCVWVTGIAALVLTVVLLAYAHPIVRLLFERGQFDWHATERVVPLLFGLVVGLVPTALAIPMARAFSALRKTNILVITAGTFVVVNAILDVLFMWLWGAFGIALATAVSYAINALILVVVLRRSIGNLGLLAGPAELVGFLARRRVKDVPQ
jgi:putative peptidoglycan lipid II flippase